jgi:hypothetical protein
MFLHIDFIKDAQAVVRAKAQLPGGIEGSGCSNNLRSRVAISGEKVNCSFKILAISE